jgi:glycosyltransferase involved in cell wall biosynthesis
VERGAILAKLKKPISKKILAKASFVIANSQWLKQLALSSDPRKEIEVIYNGADDALRFSVDPSKHDPQQFKIICVSKIEPIMGIRFLIQAFKLLSGRYAQLHLLVVGDGQERQSLEDLVRGLEIKEKVEFVGEVSHEKLGEYYKQVDLVVSPSSDDGINRETREMVAFGLPVVAFETPWIKELVQDNMDGLLAKMNEADDMAEKIERLVLDKQLLETLKKNSLLRSKELGWENIAKKYFVVYVKTKNLANIQN